MTIKILFFDNCVNRDFLLVLIITIFIQQDAESDAAKIFLEVCNAVDDQVFGITNNGDVFAEFGAEDGNIILFKKVFYRDRQLHCSFREIFRSWLCIYI